jgi:hypothetical protein
MSNTFTSAADSIITAWQNESIARRWNDASPRNRWEPACGGTEQPFTARGIRWLYCYNAYLGVHRYLNVDEDRIVEDEEYRAIVAL